MNNKLNIIVGYYNRLPHSSDVVDITHRGLTPKESVEYLTEEIIGLIDEVYDLTIVTNSTDFVNTLRYFVYKHKIPYQSVVIQYQENYLSEKHIIFLDGNGRYINSDGERIMILLVTYVETRKYDLRGKDIGKLRVPELIVSHGVNEFGENICLPQDTLYSYTDKVKIGGEWYVL